MAGSSHYEIDWLHFTNRDDLTDDEEEAWTYIYVYIDKDIYTSEIEKDRHKYQSLLLAF